MIDLRQHGPAVIGEDAQLLEHRAFEHDLFAQQLRIHGVGGQQMSGVCGDGNSKNNGMIQGNNVQKNDAVESKATFKGG